MHMSSVHRQTTPVPVACAPLVVRRTVRAAAAPRPAPGTGGGRRVRVWRGPAERESGMQDDGPRTRIRRPSPGTRGHRRTSRRCRGPVLGPRHVGRCPFWNLGAEAEDRHLRRAGCRTSLVEPPKLDEAGGTLRFSNRWSRGRRLWTYVFDDAVGMLGQGLDTLVLITDERAAVDASSRGGPAWPLLGGGRVPRAYARRGQRLARRTRPRRPCQPRGDARRALRAGPRDRDAGCAPFRLRMSVARSDVSELRQRARLDPNVE